MPQRYACLVSGERIDMSAVRTEYFRCSADRWQRMYISAARNPFQYLAIKCNTTVSWSYMDICCVRSTPWVLYMLNVEYGRQQRFRLLAMVYLYMPYLVEWVQMMMMSSHTIYTHMTRMASISALHNVYVKVREWVKNHWNSFCQTICCDNKHISADFYYRPCIGRVLRKSIIILTHKRCFSSMRRRWRQRWWVLWGVDAAASTSRCIEIFHTMLCICITYLVTFCKFGLFALSRSLSRRIHGKRRWFFLHSSHSHISNIQFSYNSGNMGCSGINHRIQCNTPFIESWISTSFIADPIII